LFAALRAIPRKGIIGVTTDLPATTTLAVIAHPLVVIAHPLVVIAHLLVVIAHPLEAIAHLLVVIALRPAVTALLLKARVVAADIPRGALRRLLAEEVAAGHPAVAMAGLPAVAGAARDNLSFL